MGINTFENKFSEYHNIVKFVLAEFGLPDHVVSSPSRVPRKRRTAFCSPSREVKIAEKVKSAQRSVW